MNRTTMPALGPNNFGLIRLLLALVVCTAHACVVSGSPVLKPFAEGLHAEFAVRMFFAISGFLISLSYERSRTLGSYFWKRFLRVYPAYGSVVLGGALLLYLVSDHSAAQYFGTAWLKYLIANLLFLNFVEPNLPGVFSGNPLQVVNASLWTLKIECLFYVLTPLLLAVRQKRNSILVLGGVYFCSRLIGAVLTRSGLLNDAWLSIQLERQIFDLLAYYVAGAIIYQLSDSMLRHWRVIFILSLGALCFFVGLETEIMVPITVATLTLLLALCPYLKPLNLSVDISYGIYILHFPLAQILVQLKIAEKSPLIFIFCLWALTAGLAWIMWLGVESRFLKLKLRIKDKTGAFHAGTS